jgi:transcription initiation factor TFIID subunit 6
MDPNFPPFFCADRLLIKNIPQEASKFKLHAKRSQLTPEDVNLGLKALRLEPVYGFSAPDPPVFKNVTGSDIYYLDDTELDLVELVNGPLPRVPLDVSVRSHWLAINGIQPAIPQNPTPAGMCGVIRPPRWLMW